MKRILALLLSAALTLSLAGCSKPAAQGSQQPQSSQSAAPSAPAAAFPVTLTDQAGREVTIASQPQRIVSGYYISTSLLLALGLEDKLVGVEAKAGSRAIYALSAPDIIDLPSVGTAKEFDLEGCAALEPDLVILPLKLQQAEDTLTQLGIPVLLVNPESQAQMDQARDLVAQATGAVAQGEALAAFGAQQSQMLAQALADTQTPTVYLAGNSSFLSTAGGKMYQSDLIAQAGGVNVAQELEDTYWAEVSYEQVLAWNPAYIILASDAQYTPQEVLNDPNLQQCAAVVNGHVYQMPDTAEAWDSPVPGGVLGAVWLGSVLHPQQVSREHCREVVEEFYQTFYGFSYAQAEGQTDDAA